jgi:hypothetical protein
MSNFNFTIEQIGKKIIFTIESLEIEPIQVDQTIDINQSEDDRPLNAEEITNLMVHRYNAFDNAFYEDRKNRQQIVREINRLVKYKLKQSKSTT